MLTRHPAVAGRFYPAAPAELESIVRGYLREATLTTAASDQVAGIVVPHAGYPYSGPVAAHAFARIAGARPGRVVLLGCSHHYTFPGASIVCEGEFQTPLGRLPIDEDFARSLFIATDVAPAEIHEPEHALEVELPFLQVVLGRVPIVPVLFGAQPSAWYEHFGRQLAGMLAKTDLVLVSTDLSHYLNNDAAHRLDRASIDALLSKDYRSFAAGIAEGSCAMCGATAVVAGMACALARGATDWRLLDYRTSGDVCGDNTRVVGYAALSFEYPGENLE